MSESTETLRQAARPQWWFGSMLLALHAALGWGIDSLFSRAMLLAHFGVFLIWQPVWRGERNLDLRQAFLVVILGLLLAGWNSWWLMAVWLAVLFALIGGNLLGSEQPRQRTAALIAAIYLLSMLLVWVVPHLFVDQQFDTTLTAMVQYGLPLLPLTIVFIPMPAASRSSSPLAVDLFYSLLLFLLVTGLVLGSFVVKQVSHGDYPLALAQSLLVMGLVLVSLSWLWNPHSGFTGIGHLLSRYLMSLGLPFERWIKGLADLAEREREPSRFLSLALHNMCELPWVAGLSWQAAHSSGELGARSRFHAEFASQDLMLTFHTKWSLSPSLLLHLKLLTQMLGHFYEAKQREEAQRMNAYTQAIYETGARLTHDVKNLLQSLRSLCAAAETSSVDEASALQALVKRQLPQIAQRLTLTLEKLQAPHQSQVSQVNALTWWEGLKQRYTRSEIAFAETATDADAMVPAELFDSVAENLLQNAIAKAQQHADMKIAITFETKNGGRLLISDSGEPVAKQIAPKLFSVPVPSRNGLGIGLYQAARQAEQAGYRLSLTHNEPGNVCFELRKTRD
jgi:signal transduction histidine kinase